MTDADRLLEQVSDQVRRLETNLAHDTVEADDVEMGHYNQLLVEARNLWPGDGILGALSPMPDTSLQNQSAFGFAIGRATPTRRTLVYAMRLRDRVQALVDALNKDDNSMPSRDQRLIERLSEEKKKLEELLIWVRTGQLDHSAFKVRIRKLTVRTTKFLNHEGAVDEADEIMTAADPPVGVRIRADSDAEHEARTGTRILTAVSEILVDWEENGVPDVTIAKSSAANDADSRATGKRVFIVHGHDEAAIQEMARVLEKLKMEPIILRELADQGRTIIEKFEDYSDVDFAVVLLTPDDVGGAMNEAKTKPRARQNVVFELGFFVGKLGRDRVFVFHKGDSRLVDELSDYQGVLLQNLDPAGAWTQVLVKELQAGGAEVDANDLL